MNKAELRQWAIARRNTLDIERLSAALCRRVTELPAFHSAEHILIYRAMPQEVDLSSLTADTGRRWYLPRCAPGRRLAIHPFVPGRTPLRPGPFGIAEPDPERTPEVEPDVPDIVLVPALLLTPDGGRLGYGGGYYDRFLPRLRADAVTVGVLPAAMVVPHLPLDPWDIPVGYVVTEEATAGPKETTSGRTGGVS
ncbi:MAG: 5-formyltetrahydrofolate cyclo-ligase [Capsulimonadales bacterium]|nr:5-formyltetrahydrofolate cyclo-ligase [Capsulimonadales bacterium]